MNWEPNLDAEGPVLYAEDETATESTWLIKSTSYIGNLFKSHKYYKIV